MIDVPPRTGAARAAGGWAGVLGAEGAHLGAVAFCAGLCWGWRQQGDDKAEEGGNRQGLAGGICLPLPSS